MSGKLEKNCHGRAAEGTGAEEKAPEAAAKASTAMAPIGVPGEQQHIIVINQVADQKDPRNLGGPQGAPGKYRVTFVLGRPRFSLLPKGYHSFADGMRGDSHLAITKPAFSPPGNPEADRIKIAGTTEEGSFVFFGHPNEKGFLGKLESDPFEAKSFNDAELKAYRAIASSLSNWAVHLDIPLHIAQVESRELRTENRLTSIVTPYLEAPFAVMPTANLLPEFRGYASLYREALGSNSPLYQFFVYSK